MKKIGNLLIKCKDKETGEEGYVELALIGEAIFKTLLEDEDFQKFANQQKSEGEK